MYTARTVGLTHGDDDYKSIAMTTGIAVYFQEPMVFSKDPEPVVPLIHGRDELTSPERVIQSLPPLIRQTAEWCTHSDLMVSPRTLSPLPDDVYGALAAELMVSTTVAGRTVFDAAAEQLGIDPFVPFAAKSRELTKQGRIGNERKALDVLVEADRLVVHRGWKPNHDQLDSIVSHSTGVPAPDICVEPKTDGLCRKIPAKKRAKIRS